MDNHQLTSVLSKDPATAPIFGGVFACNRLTQTIQSGKRLFIANTDPDNKSGEHWVAFYFSETGECIYFDSYGDPPLDLFKTFMNENAKSWTRNRQWLQHHRSSLCGQYCILFAMYMARGETLPRLLRIFDVYDHKFNDVMVKQYVDHYHPDPQTSEGPRQSCVPYLQATIHRYQ